MIFSKRIRTGFSRILTYLLLSAIALVMLFPFLVMFFTSFKLPTDTFHYPPRLLPRDPVTMAWPGLEEPVPLYRLEVAGETGKYALIEGGISIGRFADPDDPLTIYELPLRDAEPVGGFTNQERVTVLGEEAPLYEVMLDGRPERLALVGRTAFGRFARVDDPSVEVLRNVRLSQPIEEVTAHPENYQQVVELQNMDRALTNTMMVTILVVLGQLATSVLGGYAFARLRFPGRDKIFLLYLGSIMVPFILLITPLYQLMVGIGWVNNIVNLIVPWLFTAYGTFLMRQYFLTVPREIEEAGLIDGASRFQILVRILLPGATPAIATLGTFTFLYAWNSFLWPLVSINQGNRDAQVLTVVLSVMRGVSASNPNLIMAGAAFAILPPMIVYIFGQRYFVENAMGAGLKG